MDINYYLRTYIAVPDKRVEEWPLMATIWPSIFIAIIYLFTILSWGPRFMENRNPYKLTNVIRCYNVFQIVVCSIIIYGFGSNGWFTGKLSLGCEPVGSPDDPSAIRIAAFMWWTYLLKIVELIETVFFILRKKYNQVSNLHMYHHVSSMFVLWLGTKYVPGGMASFPILLNSFIHAVMYTYYLLSTLGPNWQKELDKWKNKLTILQMIQFSIIIINTSYGFRSDCNFPNIAALLFIPNVLVVFYMFYNFYTGAYCKKTE